MNLLVPGFLLGLLAIGLPVYLHLLHRADPKVRRFSATFLLDPAETTAATQRRLNYLWLLAARIAVLAVLAILFSEPIWNTTALPPGVLADRHVTLLLDQSLSMAAQDRWSQARAQGRAIVDALDPAATVQLLTTANGLHVVVPATTDHESVRAALASLPVRTTGTDFGTTMRAIGQLARGAGRSGSDIDELAFVSDLQATNMPVRFADVIPDGVPLLTISPIGGPAQPNFTVAARYDAPALVVTVAGFATPARRVPVAVRVNDAELAPLSIEVGAAAMAQGRIDNLALRSGQNSIELRIDDDDALAADNTWYQVIERDNLLPITVLAGQADLGDALFVTTALQAIREPQLKVQTLGPDAAWWSATDRAPAMVIVCDAAVLDADRLQQLNNYVAGGGAVLLAAGARTARLTAMPLTNHPLGSADSPGPANATDARGHGLQVSTSHPAVPADTALAAIRVFRWVPITPLAGDRTVIALDNGAPWLLEHVQAPDATGSAGSGRIMLMATPLDGSWSELALDTAFVPFMRAVLTYMTQVDLLPSAADTGLLLQVGDQSAGTARAAIGQVLDPDGEPLVNLADAARGTAVALDEPGIYELRTRDGSRLLAINTPRAESDLAPIDAQTLDRWQLAGNRANDRVGADRAPATPGSAAGDPATAVDDRSRSIPLSRWFLALLALILAVETLLANAHLRVRTSGAA